MKKLFFYTAINSDFYNRKINLFFLFFFGLLISSTKLIAQWSLNGNAATSTNFIGTTNAQNLRFRTNNTERMRLLDSGLSIGTTALPNVQSKLNLFQTVGNNWMNYMISTTTSYTVKNEGGRITFGYSYNGPSCFGCNSIPNILSLNQYGQVAIGLSPDDITPLPYKLVVKGGILSERLKVSIYNSDSWSDYVFSENYNLASLDYVEKYILENNHLPGIPSAQEVVKNGIDVAEMDAMLLAKIEELTLYLIELKKDNLKLMNDIEFLMADQKTE